MENQDSKKCTPKRNVLIFASVGVLVVGLLAGGFSLVEYGRVSDHLIRSEELSDTEDYLNASKSLEHAEDSWLVSLFNIRRSPIEELTDQIKTRIQDQQSYQAGWDIGNNGNWDEGLTLLSEIPGNSFYYQRAQTTIEQFRVSILSQELEVERTNRQSAEEEVERQILALNLVQDALESETVERIAAESATQNERLAKEKIQKEAIFQAERADLERDAKFLAQIEAVSQSIRADSEEAAKIQAEADTLAQTERADSEEAAKIQAQTDALEQGQRADAEERGRIRELAVTNPTIQAIVAGELKFYFEPLPIYAGTNVSRAIEDISSSFSSYSLYGAAIRRVFNSNDADITVFWLKNYGTHTIGESIFKAHIKVGIGTDNCRGDWRAFDANTVKKVLWHEIGHSIGYGHSSDPSNVMYWKTDTKFDVEQDISEVIPGGWYINLTLCKGGSYRYTFESDDIYKGFDLEVLPPGVDASGISVGEGLVYTDCGKANMVKFSDSCNVTLGASIYVGNSSLYDAVRIDGEIISLDQPLWPNMVWDQAAFGYEDADLNTYWNLFH